MTGRRVAIAVAALAVVILAVIFAAANRRRQAGGSARRAGVRFRDPLYSVIPIPNRHEKFETETWDARDNFRGQHP